MTRSNIGTVVESYGLKIVGSKLCCPKHGEKTPSLHIYEDTESFYCFGCEWSGDSITFIRFMDNCSFPAAVLKYRDITGDDVSFELKEDYENRMGSEFNEDVHTRIKENTGVDSKGYRGIRTDISKWFGVRYEYSQETGDVAKTLYPCTIGGELTGYKVRAHPKDFTNPYGETGKGCDLFGQFRFKTFNHTLLICSGEHDQLAAFQMLKDAQKNKQYDPVAVVSPTIGEGGAYKQAQAQYEWINQFKKIVVAFDNDKAGEEATKKLVEVLPRGKVFIMKMRYKDPNDYVLMGKETEFISDFWAAKPYTPDGVKSAADAFDEIAEEVTKERLTLPSYMHKMQTMMGGGILQGRLCNIIALTSVGKSSHVNRMVYHWIFNSPIVPTVVSLEATAAQYVLELLSIHLGKNLLWNKTGQEILEFLDTEEGQMAKQELCYKETGEPRFYIIDERSGDIKSLEQQAEILFTKHDCKLFVIDVLSDVLRGSSEQYAEDHMNWQKIMVKRGATIINVLHTRKLQQTKDGSTPRVNEYDALGSGSFVQSAAYNIVLHRDKLAECNIEKNTTEVELAKCRGGKTGPAGKWYYDFSTAQCYDLDDWLRDNPHMKVG